LPKARRARSYSNSLMRSMSLAKEFVLTNNIHGIH